MNPKTEHADPSGPESESGAAQPTEAEDSLHFRPIADGKDAGKFLLFRGVWPIALVFDQRDAQFLIDQHTRAEVRKAVEPLREALETVIDDLEGYEDGAPDASAFSKTVNAALAQVRSALSAHRTRESQEGSRGPAESKTE